MRIAVVIPALNEERSVGAVVRGVLPLGDVIVVDDGSVDRTGTEAVVAGAAVIRHDTSRGYDRALESGIAAALRTGVEGVVTIDADGQHDPAVVAGLVQGLSDGADVVIGVRDTTARWSETLLNQYVQRRFGLKDALCGAKAYRSAAITPQRLAAIRRSVGTGLALAMVRSGLPYATVPVTVRPRTGDSRFGRSLRANRRICEALLRTVAADASRRARRR